MKFKVGDIIRANSDIYPTANYKNHWIGKVISIQNKNFTAKTFNCDATCYINTNFYGLEEKYFDLIPEQVTVIEHFVLGNKTIVRLSNGQKGISECNPNDEFDACEGLRIATARAYGKTEEEIFGNKVSSNIAKVGDYVEVVDRLHFHNIKIGEVVKCVENSENEYSRFKTTAGTTWWLTPKEYIVLDDYKPEFNPVGKIVTVIDEGETYMLHADWIKKNFPEYLEKHCYGGTPTNGDKYEVVGVNPYDGSCDDTLYLIQGGKYNACYIIGKDGIKF